MKLKLFFSIINFFSNKEKTFIASKINLIILVIAILCIPLYFLNPDHTYRWLFIHSASIIALVLSNYFLRRNQISFAAWATILVFWVTLTYLTLTSGGVFSVISFFYVFPILFAYLLLQSQVGLLLTLLSLLALLYMYFDPFQIVTESFKPKKIDWIFTSGLFLLTTHFMVLAIFSVVRINVYKLKRENAKKRLAESKLKNLNRNLKNIVESIVSVGIIETNTKGIIKYFNTGAQNIFGYTPEELIDKVNITSFFDFEDSNYFQKEVNLEFLFHSLCSDIKENNFKREEVTLLKKDTSKCRVDLTITPLYSTKNNVSGYLFTVFDMTESYETKTMIEILNRELEEKVEQRTKELQKANQSLMEMNSEMQKTLDELANTQKYLIQSEKLAALGQLSAAIGHELNTPIGAIISACYTQNDFIENMCIPTLKEVYKLSQKDFEILVYLLNECKTFMRENNSSLARTSKKLIQNQFQNNLHLKKEDIELLLEINLDYSKPNIQNLFTDENVSNLIKILHFFCQIKKTNQIIQVASEKANIVLKSLKLYLSNPVDNKLEKIYLSKEIEILLTLIQNRIKTGIEVIRQFNAPEPFMGYKGSLNQVWINLINNAIDAMNGKGVLKITSEIEEGFVVISFEDNGRGIPIEIQHKIFEPFFTTKKDGDGIGLGLHLCRKIIENINGSISFTSEPEKTIFTVKIPLIHATS